MTYPPFATMRSVYFLLLAGVSVFWVWILPTFGFVAFPVLSILLTLSVAVGLSDSAVRPLAVTVMIPVIARLASVTLSPVNQSSQYIVMLSVLFCLGFSYAFPVIRWRMTLPGLWPTVLGLVYLVSACGIGLMAGYLFRNQPIEPVAMNIVYVLFLLYIAIAEELVFRGAILSYAKHLLHPVIAVSMTALLYGSLYAGSSPPVFVLMCIASILVSWMHYISGRLWPGMIFTFLWKLISVLMVSHSLTFLGM